MIKPLLTALALAGSPLLGLAADPFDAQLAEAARLTGAQAAGAVMGQLPQVDADGKPVLDATGRPVLKAADPEGLRGSLRMFQDMTGIQGVTSVTSPAQAARAGVANVAVKSSFQFSCVTGSARGPFSAAPLALLVDSCALVPGSTAVASVAFLICENAANAGTCDTAADYSKAVRINAGQYAAVNTASLGLGCNTAGVCLLSMTGTYAIGGSDAAIRSQASQMAGGSNVLGNLRDNVIGSDYGQKVTEIGTPFAKCAQANADAAQTGRVSTCEEDPQTVQLVATQDSAQCTGERKCSPGGWATTVTNFTRSCQRTFPVTQRISKLSYPRTATCELRTYLEDSAPATNSCLPKTGTALTEGMVKVGTAEAICEGGLNEKDECLHTLVTEFWAQTTDPVLLQQTASPSQVGGQCDTRLNSDTRTTSCAIWFGRTKSLGECTFVPLEGSAQVDSAYLGVSYLQKAGCGVCVEPTVSETCYSTTNPTSAELSAGAEAPDSCASMDLSGCSLSSATALNYSGEGSGLVTAQQEVYSCRSKVSQCTRWEAQDASCLSTDMAMGLDKFQAGPGTMDGSFNNAMVAAATIDGTARGLEGAQDEALPKLFTGEALACRRPSGGVGKLLQKNCCRSDLERPLKGNVIQGGCEMPEVKLAAARRSSYASYRGDYCSRRVKTWFFTYCLEMSSSFCVFPGILPKLVQEQGRKQLETMTATSASADIKRAPLNFNYLDRAGGSWTPLTVVNGVRMSVWQWPAHCADPELAATTLLNDPSAKSCPGVVSSWVASCNIATGCGELPADPTQGAFNWTLKNVNPLERETTAVSRFAVVKGACNTLSGACAYEASAWPVGVGGRAVVTRDLTWELFGTTLERASEGAPTPQLYRINNMGDLMFKGFVAPGPVTAMPASVRMDFSRDGGQTWATLAIPTTSLAATEMTLPGSDVTLTGSCDVAQNLCTFRVTGTVTVTAKSWGSPERPDCSGFTPGQLAVLDFSKMDLSEWLASVMDKMSAKDPQKLAGQAAAQFAAFNALYQDGTVKATAPVAAAFARIMPAEGFGPFNATLSVSGFWPEATGDPAQDTDKVLRVAVDWGDCEKQEVLEPVDPELGVGFRGSRAYGTPDSYACKGNPRKNLVHEVTLTVTTSKSGMQTRKLSVENAWSKFPGADSNNVRIPLTTSTGTPAQSTLPPTLQ